jgi:hypothetical protein
MRAGHNKDKRESLHQVDAAEKILEARVGVKALEFGVHFRLAYPSGALVVQFFQLATGFVAMAWV